MMGGDEVSQGRESEQQLALVRDLVSATFVSMLLYEVEASEVGPWA